MDMSLSELALSPQQADGTAPTESHACTSVNNTSSTAFQQPTEQRVFHGAWPVKNKGNGSGAAVSGRGVVARGDSIGSLPSRPLQWNHTTTAGSAALASSEQDKREQGKDAIVVDNPLKRKEKDSTMQRKGKRGQGRQRGSKKLHPNSPVSVVVNEFKPDPNEEYLINFDEFEIKSLKRITAPAGRVVYEVTYMDGNIVELSSSEVYNHIDPDVVERLENMYFEQDINAETIYDELDPEYPGGTPSGGTYAQDMAQAMALEEFAKKKRRKNPPPERAQKVLEPSSKESERGDGRRSRAGRPRKIKFDFRMETHGDSGSSSSSLPPDSILARSLAESTADYLASRVADPDDRMDFTDEEATAQHFNDGKTLNKEIRTVIPLSTPPKSRIQKALSPPTENYIAPFDDEDDEDFMPNPKTTSPQKRPVKRPKPSPSDRKPSSPPISTLTKVSQPLPKKPGPTFQVPITSIFKTMGSEKQKKAPAPVPNKNPTSSRPKNALGGGSDPQKSIPIPGPKVVPSLAMVGASPTVLTKSLFPPPPPPTVSNLKSKSQSQSLSTDHSPITKGKTKSHQEKNIGKSKTPKSRPSKIVMISSQSPESVEEISDDDISMDDAPSLRSNKPRPPSRSSRQSSASITKQSKRKSRTPKLRDPTLSPQPDDIDEVYQDEVEPEEYVVESIIAFRRVNGRKEYLTKWLGYPEQESTWEAEENFVNSRDLVEEFERTRLRGG